MMVWASFASGAAASVAPVGKQPGFATKEAPRISSRWSGDPVGGLEVGCVGHAVGLLVDILREPIIGREVDGLDPPLRKRPGHLHRRRVRDGEEDEVGVNIARVDILKDEIGQPPEVGVDRGDGGAVELARRRRDDLRGRVVQQEPHQLTAGVSGCTDNRNFHKRGCLLYNLKALWCSARRAGRPRTRSRPVPQALQGGPAEERISRRLRPRRPRR